MSDLRKDLIDRIIKLYGIDSPIAMDFYRLCSEWENNRFNDEQLQILVECHEVCGPI